MRLIPQGQKVFRSRPLYFGLISWDLTPMESFHLHRLKDGTAEGEQEFPLLLASLSLVQIKFVSLILSSGVRVVWGLACLCLSEAW